ncbi:MAG: hypothetical protein ACC726_17515, partial [Chloroflexota bacterium]
LAEISELLGADPDTVKGWARAGRIPSVILNDKGVRLFERPAELHHACGWCGDPIPAKPALRGGRKWCSTRCCYAAYRSRKRAAKSVGQQAATTAARHGSLPERADEVQSLA